MSSLWLSVPVLSKTIVALRRSVVIVAADIIRDLNL
jgi:hypothetical protein